MATRSAVRLSRNRGWRLCIAVLALYSALALVLSIQLYIESWGDGLHSSFSIVFKARLPLWLSLLLLTPLVMALAARYPIGELNKKRNFAVHVAETTHVQMTFVQGHKAFQAIVPVPQLMKLVNVHLEEIGTGKKNEKSES